mgnify:CR=1 FL=1
MPGSLLDCRTGFYRLLADLFQNVLGDHFIGDDGNRRTGDLQCRGDIYTGDRSLLPHYTQNLHAVSPLEIQFTNATIVHDVLPFLFKTYPTIPFPEQSDSCLRFLSRTHPEVLLFIHFITNFYELQLKKCQIR